MQAEAREAIRHYLASVNQRLSHLPDGRRAETLSDLESHIYDALNERTGGAEATVEDVNAVLAEMDPPESYGPRTAPSRESRLWFVRGRSVPMPLRFGLVVLVAIVVIQLLVALGTGNVRFLLGVALSALCFFGLQGGYKTAYVITIAGVIIGSIHAGITKGPGFGIFTFLLDCLVLVPVLMSTEYFFPKARTESWER